jgi:hypothetical protein
VNFTVGQLKELLADLPDSMPVVVSSDEEGNNIRLANGAYQANVEELLYAYMEEIHEDDLHEYDEYYSVLEIW